MTGNDVIVEYMHENPYTIGAKSFGTHMGYEGVWRVLKDAGKNMSNNNKTYRIPR